MPTPAVAHPTSVAQVSFMLPTDAEIAALTAEQRLER